MSFRLHVARSENGSFAPNAFIRIADNDVVTLVMPQVEMGQGVYTSIAMILADELDADFAKVIPEHAPPSDALYGNPFFHIQVTGNSNSVRAFWTPLRQAGATARAMLVAAAAAEWGVDAGSCRTSNSQVIHDASGRKLSYGALAGKANSIKLAAEPQLKALKDFTLIGKPLKRKDTPEKVNGKAKYGIDAMPAGVRFAAVAECPVFGGKVGQVDDSKAKAIGGVQQVVVLDDLVAVVGDTMWSAMKGLAALDITWDEGPNAAVNSAQIWEHLRAASKQAGAVAKTEGDVKKAFDEGERIEAEYEMPFLAHAVLEPINCTIHLTKDACEVWTGTQVMTLCPWGRRQCRRPPARESDSAQSFIGRRLRPEARAGHGREGGAHRSACRRAHQSRLVARRGHAA